MDKKQSHFKDERKQTDDSLTLERGKTDESFNSGRENTHENTDESVSKDRILADESRLQRRNDADLKRDSNPISEEVGKALKHQRKSDDKEIEIERSNMDVAIEYERGEKKRLMNILVSQEREATDKNLLVERNTADLATDLSAERLTQEQDLHLKTQSALTTREEFVAIVSHDLRNPIGAILSSTELLLDATAFTINEDTKNFIQLIRRNAETSLRLISDILDMERIVEGKLELNLTKNQVDELIKNSVESYAHLAAEKKISLKLSPSNSMRKINCDKDRFAQILSNLIGNAIKYTPAGGTVTVDSSETKNELTISVRDTGPGIPEEQKTKIFERFAQLKNKDRGGIGLGLYISKTLVESHSGKIWVTSSPGSGSTFSFTIPI